MRFFAAPGLLILAACVTHAPSPVGPAFLSACAPPSVSVAVTDDLPRAYDEALHAAFSPEGTAPVGYAAMIAEEIVARELTPRLTAYRGDAPCALTVEVANVILPDATRFTALSGMKSYGVLMTLTAPDGAVLAETTRPFTVLAEPQRHGRLGGSAWRRLGNTDDLRVEVIVSLSEATARIVSEAVTGGQAQSGMSGRLVAYPERLEPAAPETFAAP